MKSRQLLTQGMVAAVLTAISIGPVSGNPLYDTAVVHYAFETLGGGGEVTDSNTNSVNLIAFDASALGGTAALVPGPDGIGNGINLPDGMVLTTTGTGSDDSELDVTRDTPFTIASWVKQVTLGDRLFLASKVQREEFEDGDGLELRGWSFVVNTGGFLQAIWREDNTPTAGTVGEARILVNTNTAITDTDWHHIALTFSYDELDVTRGMRIYIDGELQAMTAASTGLAGVDDVDLSATGWPFNVGGRYDTQLNEGGSLDELAIWNSVLSSQDIASLAGVTSSLPGDFDDDGEVDGRDFLAWQRGESPSPLSAADLSDWQNNYAVPVISSIQAGSLTSVPEPKSVVLGAIVIAVCGVHGRKRKVVAEAWKSVSR